MIIILMTSRVRMFLYIYVDKCIHWRSRCVGAGEVLQFALCPCTQKLEQVCKKIKFQKASKIF